MEPTLDSRFSISDYIVFFSILFISFGIGIYSYFTGRKKIKTPDDFYFGNHEMNVVAVAMSLAATLLSAIGLLGVPTEIYRYGISYSVFLIAETTGSLVALFLFIPFFYRLGLASVYEYFEHRFNRTIRRCACLLYIVNMMLYMAVVLYAPALAISQVSGLPIWVSLLSGGIICTIYTSLGGMKAIIWTDAFQMVVMLCGVLLILVHGVISSGGPARVVEASRETGRLRVSFDPDPTVTRSFWALSVGGLFTVLPFTLNQQTVQRYLSVKNERAAQRMMAMKLPVILVWVSILIMLGGTMFGYYNGCDPLLGGRIERSDQMVPIFVQDVLGYLQGLPGLFTAVVYCATLSTVSSGINSIVLVITEDFIKPLHNHRTKTDLKKTTEMLITKCLSFFVGFGMMGLAFISSVMARTLIQFVMSIDGMCGGPLLGLFFCGMVLPYCNSKGAAVGVLSGLIVTFWIGIGSLLAAIPQPPLPLSMDSCPIFNSSGSSVSNTFTTDATSLARIFPEDSTTFFSVPPIAVKRDITGVNWVYSISYQYYGLIGFFVTVTMASAVSFITGRQDSSKIPERFFLYNVFSKMT